MIILCKQQPNEYHLNKLVCKRIFSRANLGSLLINATICVPSDTGYTKTYPSQKQGHKWCPSAINSAICHKSNTRIAVFQPFKIEYFMMCQTQHLDIINHIACRYIHATEPLLISVYLGKYFVQFVNIPHKLNGVYKLSFPFFLMKTGTCKERVL